MSLQNSNPPLVSADGTNPTRDIDVASGTVGFAASVNLALGAAMVKRLDQAWAPGGASGAPQGGCDVGTKGGNQTWTAFLIGTPQLAFTSFSRTSGVATVTIPGHPLGVGGTLLIGGPSGGIAGFDGAHAITAVTANTVSFASAGADYSSANQPSPVWGYPVVRGFDVIASQGAKPTPPSGFGSDGGAPFSAPLATVATDGAGNIATITNVTNS